MSDLNSPELMTVKETSEYLRIPLPTVYYLVQRGQLPAVQIGGRWRIKRSLLDRDVLRKEDEAGQPSPSPPLPHYLASSAAAAAKAWSPPCVRHHRPPPLLLAVRWGCCAMQCVLLAVRWGCYAVQYVLPL